MKTRPMTQAAARARLFMNGVWVLPLLLALLASLGGCLSLAGLEQEKPNPEIAIQTADYGTITQITSARMKGNEIHWGDIAITVDTDDGRVVIVSQPEDDVYAVGDRVRVIRDNQGFLRVQLIS